jgi:DNA-binding MarR family transcriptional regulator
MSGAAPLATPRSSRSKASLTQTDYRALAEFRYQIRCFLSFSEKAARSVGIEPQQHQALLALKGLPEGRRPTIKTLAERLCVQHHTAVSVVDHLEARALIRREASTLDRREVLVTLTPAGERLLQGLSILHSQQLRTVGPTLVDALGPLLRPQGRAPGRRAGRKAAASLT